MSLVVPVAATEIAKVAEAAGQLGIEKENILAFTRTMVDLGVATNLTSEEAATMLAQFANVTGVSQKEFSNLGSTIVALGNNFATTERDIVEMAQRLAARGLPWRAGAWPAWRQRLILALARAMMRLRAMRWRGLRHSSALYGASTPHQLSILHVSRMKPSSAGVRKFAPEKSARPLAVARLRCLPSRRKHALAWGAARGACVARLWHAWWALLRRKRISPRNQLTS
jgi:hypothetical protein